MPNSYVWMPDGDQQLEAVGWSRVRFRNYAFIRINVRPGHLVSEMDVVAVDEYGPGVRQAHLPTPCSRVNIQAGGILA